VRVVACSLSRSQVRLRGVFAAYYNFSIGFNRREGNTVVVIAIIVSPLHVYVFIGNVPSCVGVGGWFVSAALLVTGRRVGAATAADHDVDE